MTGREPARLHVLYGLLPLGVSFIAEQLRLVAADQVLARRGLENARAMEELPEAEQQRDRRARSSAARPGVMAASALVVFLCAAARGRLAQRRVTASVPYSPSVSWRPTLEYIT